MKSEEASHLTIEDALNSGDLQLAIQVCENYCKNLNVLVTTWPGVPPRDDRRTQARESVKKLAGFYSAIKIANAAYWANFKEVFTTTAEKKRSLGPVSNPIAKIIGMIRVPEAESWLEDAKAELDSFTQYVDIISRDQGMVKIAKELTPEKISEIVANFFSQYVGHGKTRIKGFERFGFDGRKRSCPISVAPRRGIVYLSYLYAEYVLMSAIADEFNLLGKYTDETT